MDWQTPLPTDVSFLRQDVEKLADTITDADFLCFRNLSYEDLDDPIKSTRIRALQARSNMLVVNAEACNAVDEHSVKSVVEVAKVSVLAYART